MYTDTRRAELHNQQRKSTCRGQACGGTALSQLSRGRGRGTIVSSKPAGPTQPVPGQPVQSIEPCPKSINIQVNTPVVEPVVALRQNHGNKLFCDLSPAICGGLPCLDSLNIQRGSNRDALTSCQESILLVVVQYHDPARPDSLSLCAKGRGGKGALWDTRELVCSRF